MVTTIKARDSCGRQSHYRGREACRASHRDHCRRPHHRLLCARSGYLVGGGSQRCRRRFGLPTTTVINDGEDTLPTAAPVPAAADPNQAAVPVVVALVGVDDRVTGALARLSVPTTVNAVVHAADLVTVPADIVIVDFDRLGTDSWNELAAAVAAVAQDRVAVAVITAEPKRPDWQRAHTAGAWAYLSNRAPTTNSPGSSTRSFSSTAPSEPSATTPADRPRTTVATFSDTVGIRRRRPE